MCSNAVIFCNFKNTGLYPAENPTKKNRALPYEKAHILPKLRAIQRRANLMIATLFKWLGVFIVLIVAALAVTLIGARFADGPIAIVAGGPFTSGTPYVGEEPDWTFVKDRQEVVFQLMSPARSRTTWIVEHEGRIYIPCGYMNTAWGKMWKQWPIEAEKDGRAVLRVDGQLYDRKLVRITEGDALPHIVGELGRKYLSQLLPAEEGADEQTMIQGGLAQIAEGSLWVFEMAPAG